MGDHQVVRPRSEDPSVPAIVGLVPDLPSLRPVMTTPLGAQVLGFTAAGQDALTWSRRLRQVASVTGVWPVLMDQDTPEYLSNSYEFVNPAESVALAETLNGAGILVARLSELAQVIGSELMAEARATLGEQESYPSELRRPGFGLPFGWTGEPMPVTVALVPATTGWQVPAVLHYGGWNDYPVPAEHAAILRYWQARYGTELVVLTGTTAEFAVSRPPSTTPEALALAWEYTAYNDGAYDNYGAADATELATCLVDAPVWRAWWD